MRAWTTVESHTEGSPINSSVSGICLIWDFIKQNGGEIWDYGITGLSENMDRDDAIEESYWGTFRESTPQPP